MVAIPLVSSTATFAEPNQIIATLNAFGGTIGSLLAPAGAGSLAGAINLPAASSQVNLLSITGGATGSPVLLGVGGPSAGTSVDLIIDGNAPSGAVGIGGIGTVRAGAALVVPFNSTSANFIQISGAASGSPPIMSVGGSDTNQDLMFQAKGTGTIGIGGTGTAKAGAALQIVSVGTQVNGLQITAAISGADPSIAVFGSDTNRNLVLSPLGTGTIKFGTTGMISANGTVNQSFTNSTAPAGASVSIQRWLTFIDATGRTGFIPVW